MSRPYRFKVKVQLEGQRFEALFCVRSISPTRQSQIFTSSMQCAEPPCLDHTGSRSKVWGFISCPLHISKTAQRISKKLGSDVHLIKAMCRTHCLLYRLECFERFLQIFEVETSVFCKNNSSCPMGDHHSLMNSFEIPWTKLSARQAHPIYFPWIISE